VRKLKPHRTILTHIEEPDGLGYDDLQRLETSFQGTGLNISFAWDTRMIDFPG
jgi:phosphoribosyl 1,2-cyclic phosphate phosphodiesterase